MPFPPALDQAIRNRFSDLITEGGTLRSALANVAPADRDSDGRQQHVVLLMGEAVPLVTAFQSYRARAVNLIDYVGASPKFADEVRQGVASPSHVGKIVGILHGLADDYAKGFLDSVLRRAEAEVAADYLGQAEGLLKEGQPGKYDHVPAAVLLGAILEQALRTLCARQTPPVPTTKANGEKLMLNALIDDLKKAGVYNELKAKQLRAWADIRNAAAHGEFAKFSRGDVDGMQQGVASFLADQL